LDNRRSGSSTRSPWAAPALPATRLSDRVSQVTYCVQGVISPILANVYLHEVLDGWFETEVRPRLYGRGFLIRYADDGVFGFTDRRDAERVLTALHRRFGRYGLTLHEEKTRIVPFQQPGTGALRQELGPEARPGSFDFLGFRHFWATSQRGLWVVRRKRQR